MICPKCKHNNSEDALNCQNCNKKLKMTCPKCKSINNIDQESCHSCGFKLVYPCPSCKQPYLITSKACDNCGFKIFKNCTKCGAINTYNKNECTKCGHSFEEKPKETDSEENINEYPLLCAELINLASIKSKIKNPQIIQKLLNDFYKTIGINANLSGSTAKKIDQNLVLVNFKTYDDAKTASISSIYTASKIIKDIQEYNLKLKNKVNISLKIKIGISMQHGAEKPNYAVLERNLASNEEIIIDNTIYNQVYDIFKFDTLTAEGKYYFKYFESEPQENKEIPQTEIETKEPDTPEIVPNELNAEPVEITQEHEVQQPELQPVSAIEEPFHVMPEETELQQADIIEEPHPKEPPEKTLSKEETQISNEKELNSEKAHLFLFNLIQKAENGFVVELSAKDGAGKTSVISGVRNALSQEKILWLNGQCQPFNQFVPFGLIKDIFKNLFNLPSQIININESKQSIVNTLENALGIKDNAIERTLTNLIFSEIDHQKTDIMANQVEFYNNIQTIFNAVTSKVNSALIIEDVEYIDKSSLECIKHLIQNGLLNHKFQIIVTHIPEFNFKNHLSDLEIDNRIFTLKLKPLETAETQNALLNMLNGFDIIPSKLKNKIIEKSKGLPLYIEQAVWILYNSGAIIKDDEGLKFNPEASAIDLPDTVEDLIQIRIGQINTLSANAFNIITAASILGYKFIPPIIQNLSNINQQEFTQLLNTLGSMGFFVQTDKHNLIFKHKLIWQGCYQALNNSPQKTTYLRNSLNILINYTKSSASILALIAENADMFKEALTEWSNASQQALTIGDIDVYTRTQERALSLIENIDIPEKDKIKNNIYEQLGITNYSNNPEQASNYLANAILNAENDNNIAKVVYLSGFLAKASEFKGDYAGSLECSDKAISLIDKEILPLEHALLNYSKLETLFNLGRLEELIVLASHDILPILNQAFEKKKTIADLEMNELASIMLETELFIGKALAFQGNKNCIQVLQSVATKAVELDNADIEAIARLTEAIFKTVQGDLKSTNAMLEYIKSVIPRIKDKNYAKCYWALTNLAVKMVEGEYDQVSNIAFTVSGIAKDFKDFHMQAILKLLIGKILKEAKNFENANAMYNDTIQYSSEHKLATCALLGWYFIADIKIDEGNLDNALGIAAKALEVASKPNINNSIFKILLNKLISEVYMLKGDFENSKIYIEQAIELATKMELHLFLTKLYLLYGKSYQEMAVSNELNRQENAINAQAFYLTSLQFAERIENESLIGQINNEINNLNTFCQLAGIKL